MSMILPCNFEELNALREGARAVLKGARGRESTVAAPPESRARVEALVARLEGSLSIETLGDQRAVEVAIDAIVSELREAMEQRVLSLHPAHEEAVESYFSFAHALAVQSRLHQMGDEMEALIGVDTGRPPDEDSAQTFVFPERFEPGCREHLAILDLLGYPARSLPSRIEIRPSRPRR